MNHLHSNHSTPSGNSNSIHNSNPGSLHTSSINSNNDNGYKTNTFDDPNNRRIFVGGLKHSITEDDLFQFFQHFGPIETTVIMKKWDNQQSRGFGFVTFHSVETAREVVHYHQIQPLMMNGRRIDCQLAQKENMNKQSEGKDNKNYPIMPTTMLDSNHNIASSPLDNSHSPLSSNNNNASPTSKRKKTEKYRRIFVGGLQQNVTREEVQNYFERFGMVEDLQMILNRRTPFAFITFSNEESVKEVLDHFHSGQLTKEFHAHDVRNAMPKGSFSYTKQREREMEMGYHHSHRSYPYVPPYVYSAPPTSYIEDRVVYSDRRESPEESEALIEGKSIRKEDRYRNDDSNRIHTASSHPHYQHFLTSLPYHSGTSRKGDDYHSYYPKYYPPSMEEDYYATRGGSSSLAYPPMYPSHYPPYYYPHSPSLYYPYPTSNYSSHTTNRGNYGSYSSRSSPYNDRHKGGNRSFDSNESSNYKHNSNSNNRLSPKDSK
ncbi:hypothetical protein ABK040_010666 [Willaertia magna]